MAEGQLATVLEGKALQVLLDLDPEEPCDFNTLSMPEALFWEGGAHRLPVPPPRHAEKDQRRETQGPVCGRDVLSTEGVSRLPAGRTRRPGSTIRYLVPPFPSCDSGSFLKAVAACWKTGCQPRSTSALPPAR
ncbi:hypothetical protein EOD39_10145 [Acipenser ruthenus]|uniref:Uncharacterized protein n=1 Tax=Acipenser ruthenus TaxID=7906 RepID=A0A662YUH0_ACIRT|nr:hypothetical protein EOD39_10145 [Acipenser ruthenus]